MLRQLVYGIAPRRDAADGQPRIVRRQDVARRVSDHQRLGGAQLARASPGGADDVRPRLRVAAISAEAESAPEPGAGELQLGAAGEVPGAEPEQHVGGRGEALEQGRDPGARAEGVAGAV